MEQNYVEGGTDCPDASKASDPIDAKSIPLTLLENDAPPAARGNRQFARGKGQQRQVGVQAQVSVTWNNDANHAVRTTLTFTPKAYKVRNGDLRNDDNLLDEDTFPTTTQVQAAPGLNTSAVTVGITTNGRGNYYVSVLIDVLAANGDEGTDEIFVRFDHA